MAGLGEKLTAPGVQGPFDASGKVQGQSPARGGGGAWEGKLQPLELAKKLQSMPTNLNWL